MCIIVIYLNLVTHLVTCCKSECKNSCGILAGHIGCRCIFFLLLKYISCEHCTFIIVIYTIMQLILPETLKLTKSPPYKTDGNVYNN